MAGRRGRRSSGVAGRTLGAVVLLACDCIDVGQIRAPIADKNGPSGGATDAGTDARPPVDAAPGSVAFGGPCDGNEDCAEGTCVDGVCCRQGSCPVCQVCGTGGNCVRVGAGIVEPHFRCHPPDSPDSCGKSGACDGMGACAFYPPNVECAAGTCDGDAVVGASVCDGHGQCVPGARRICAPFRCVAGACLASCNSSADCSSGESCVNRTCGRKQTGSRCQSNEDCLSNFCADGVCCNVACREPCVSCNQVGTAGICWPINANEPDPHASCADTGAASCGSTGVCDGAGGCLRYNVTTVCKRTCAADGSALTTSYCDGQGACNPTGMVLACPTNVCDAAMPACR